MGERYTAEMADRFLREKTEREAAAELARREQSEKQSARKAWVEDGGSEGDFERQWTELRDEARRRRVMDADRAAREAQRARGVSRI